MTTVNYTTLVNASVHAATTITRYVESTTFGSDDATSSQSVPIAAIVGGAAAGAFLAIAVVVIWVLWGKSIKRTQIRERLEAERRTKTRTNTISNANLTQPRPHAYQPLYNRPSDRKIKFASFRDMTTKTSSSPTTRPSPLLLDPCSTYSAAAAKQTTRQTTQRLSPQNQKRTLPHKPSTISSSSTYSAESGEMHRAKVPSSLIVALGMGDAGDQVDTAHQNNAERRLSWSDRGLFLFHQHQGYVRTSQHSQASTQASIEKSDEQPEIIMGLAY